MVEGMLYHITHVRTLQVPFLYRFPHVSVELEVLRSLQCRTVEKDEIVHVLPNVLIAVGKEALAGTNPAAIFKHEHANRKDHEKAF